MCRRREQHRAGRPVLQGGDAGTGAAVDIGHRVHTLGRGHDRLPSGRTERRPAPARHPH